MSPENKQAVSPSEEKPYTMNNVLEALGKPTTAKERMAVYNVLYNAMRRNPHEGGGLSINPGKIRSSTGQPLLLFNQSDFDALVAYLLEKQPIVFTDGDGNQIEINLPGVKCRRLFRRLIEAREKKESVVQHEIIAVCFGNNSKPKKPQGERARFLDILSILRKKLKPYGLEIINLTSASDSHKLPKRESSYSLCEKREKPTRVKLGKIVEGDPEVRILTQVERPIFPVLPAEQTLEDQRRIEKKERFLALQLTSQVLFYLTRGKTDKLTQRIKIDLFSAAKDRQNEICAVVKNRSITKLAELKGFFAKLLADTLQELWIKQPDDLKLSYLEQDIVKSCQFLKKQGKTGINAVLSDIYQRFSIVVPGDLVSQ